MRTSNFRNTLILSSGTEEEMRIRWEIMINYKIQHTSTVLQCKINHLHICMTFAVVTGLKLSHLVSEDKYPVFTGKEETTVILCVLHGRLVAVFY